VHGDAALGSSCPCVTGEVQLPLAFAQLMQVVVQASAQHRPSTQLFDTQSLGWPHGCPVLRRQTPPPLHASVPAHAGTPLGSSFPAATSVVQVPLAFAHDLHWMVQPSAQQRPSTQ